MKYPTGECATPPLRETDARAGMRAQRTPTEQAPKPGPLTKRLYCRIEHAGKVVLVLVLWHIAMRQLPSAWSGKSWQRAGGMVLFTRLPDSSRFRRGHTDGPPISNDVASLNLRSLASSQDGHPERGFAQSNLSGPSPDRLRLGVWVPGA